MLSQINNLKLFSSYRVNQMKDFNASLDKQPLHLLLEPSIAEIW